MARRRTNGQYLTAGEVARRLGISRLTLLRAVRRGHLNPAQPAPGGLHRFETAAVLAYAERLVMARRTPARRPARRRQQLRRHGQAPGRPRPRYSSRRLSRERLRTLYATVACGVLTLAADGTVTDANVAARRILGLDHALTQSRFLDQALAATTREDGVLLPVAERPLQVALRTGQPQRAVVVGITRLDGEHCWIQMDVAPLLDVGGAPREVIASFIDITARKMAEEALRWSQQRYRALTEHSTDLVTIVDAQGDLHYVSPSYRRVLGYNPGALQRTSVFAIIHPDDLPCLQQTVEHVLAAPGAMETATLRVRHAAGSWRTVEFVVVNHVDDPAVRGIVATGRDVSERVRAEEALRHHTVHDALTGLPNRTLLQDRIDQAIQGMAPDSRPVALLLLDLDRFKDVNDSLGHHYGDLLLRQVAERLRGELQTADTVARLGGDEFAVLLPYVDETAALGMARTILRALAAPILLENHLVDVGASIGAAFAPAHGADAATLLRHADVALYVAKRKRGSVAVYDPAKDSHNLPQFGLLSDLRQALTTDGLELYYQPVVDTASGHAVGVEALMRWPHPTQGVIQPDRFISLAEQTDLITPLTGWALKTALLQARTWQETGLDLRVVVNLSMRTLLNARLPATIADLLRRYDIAPAYLTLEVTESALMNDAERAQEMLARLRDLGVRLSIDDFGTGYSSLGYLKQLPVDAVKIDRSFVQDMSVDGETGSVRDTALVRSIIAMAHALDLSVVAEGVETMAAWSLLREMGCEEGQGYYLGRPMRAEHLERWLRAEPWAVA